jgi:hypothetical protein
MAPRPLDVEVGDGPGWVSQSPGRRFLCLGLRTHTVRTKDTSFCLKAPAARPPHRNISATATPNSFLFFSRTNRRVKHHRPRPGSPLLSHAHYAGSSSQLLVDIGQWSRPGRAGEGRTASEGLLRTRSTQHLLAIGHPAKGFAHAPSCPHALQRPWLWIPPISKFKRVSDHAVGWASLESCLGRNSWSDFAWRLWLVLPLCSWRELITAAHKA